MINRTQATAAFVLLALSGTALAAPGQHAASAGSGRTSKATTGTTTTTTTTGTTTGTGTTTTTGTGTGCGPGGPGGGHGPGRAPSLSGTLTAIDTAAGTLTVTPVGGGTASVIALTSGTTLIGHQTIAASAIAVGDTLEVAGVPLSLQATSLVDNRLPDPTVATGTAGAASSGGASGAGAFIPGTLRVVGTVTSLAPLEIEVNGSFALTLSTTSATTFAEVVPLTLSQLAVGEAVRAVVVRSSTGTLTAVLVDVTVTS